MGGGARVMGQGEIKTEEELRPQRGMKGVQRKQKVNTSHNSRHADVKEAVGSGFITDSRRPQTAGSF